LGAGVPDLVSGRRPVVPPFARIHGASGAVEVRFSIDGAGKTTVHEVTGPDLLKPQADEAVRSWVFRRTTPERLFLVATFTYEGPKATAAVELHH
jgi:outer membrane biosynthesis protein TonB